MVLQQPDLHQGEEIVSLSVATLGTRPASVSAARALLFFSGIAGLGYEIVWTEQLGLALGHESIAVLAVLAAFFAGLSIGAWLIAHVLERSARPARLYVWCELAIALWALNLITWNKSGGGLTEAPPRPLPTTVTVEGNTLRYAAALTDLPRIVTLIWLFGASAQLPSNDYVLDDCNNMGDQIRPDGTAAPTSAPPTTLPKVALGVPLTHRSGAIVTIDEVQKPPAELQPLPIAPDEGNVPAVVYAEICAGDSPPGHPSRNRFQPGRPA